MPLSLQKRSMSSALARPGHALQYGGGSAGATRERSAKDSLKAGARGRSVESNQRFRKKRSMCAIIRIGGESDTPLPPPLNRARSIFQGMACNCSPYARNHSLMRSMLFGSSDFKESGEGAAILAQAKRICDLEHRTAHRAVGSSASLKGLFCRCSCSKPPVLRMTTQTIAARAAARLAIAYQNYSQPLM